jgi:hypothetical protein
VLCGTGSGVVLEASAGNGARHSAPLSAVIIFLFMDIFVS